MKIIWLIASVGAHLEVRIQEAFLKTKPAWVFPTSPLVNGPVSKWQEGWVKPGTRVQIGRDMQWLNSGFEWKSPPLPGGLKIRNNQECRMSSPSKTSAIECYIEGYSGYYWGQAQRVSEMQVCRYKRCIFYSQFPRTISYQSAPQINYTSSLHKLVRPSSPPYLYREIKYNTSNTSTVMENGPINGYLWFKPLMWAISGWYYNITIDKNCTRVHTYQLEIKFPLSFKIYAEGIYFVSDRR